MVDGLNSKFKHVHPKPRPPQHVPTYDWQAERERGREREVCPDWLIELY